MQILITNRYVCSVATSGEQIYKNFFDCKDDDHKIETLHIMLERNCSYAKSMMTKLNACTL